MAREGIERLEFHEVSGCNIIYASSERNETTCALAQETCCGDVTIRAHPIVCSRYQTVMQVRRLKEKRNSGRLLDAFTVYRPILT